ncbi:unnamed protein product [Polarella glacialis]|uniref:Uncharacterized protein n=1 Tax=Polarella glacialis TaxID=89957 RepID=A0A813M0H7_POLGL|nr:unnamed protein product [Polarella glacialis]
MSLCNRSSLPTPQRSISDHEVKRQYTPLSYRYSCGEEEDIDAGASNNLEGVLAASRATTRQVSPMPLALSRQTDRERRTGSPVPVTIWTGQSTPGRASLRRHDSAGVGGPSAHPQLQRQLSSRRNQPEAGIMSARSSFGQSRQATFRPVGVPPSASSASMLSPRQASAPAIITRSASSKVITPRWSSPQKSMSGFSSLAPQPLEFGGMTRCQAADAPHPARSPSRLVPSGDDSRSPMPVAALVAEPAGAGYCGAKATVLSQSPSLTRHAHPSAGQQPWPMLRHQSSLTDIEQHQQQPPGQALRQSSVTQLEHWQLSMPRLEQLEQRQVLQSGPSSQTRLHQGQVLLTRQPSVTSQPRQQQRPSMAELELPQDFFQEEGDGEELSQEELQRKLQQLQKLQELLELQQLQLLQKHHQQLLRQQHQELQQLEPPTQSHQQQTQIQTRRFATQSPLRTSVTPQTPRDLPSARESVGPGSQRRASNTSVATSSGSFSSDTSARRRRFLV